MCEKATSGGSFFDLRETADLDDGGTGFILELFVARQGSRLRGAAEAAHPVGRTHRVVPGQWRAELTWGAEVGRTKTRPFMLTVQRSK